MAHALSIASDALITAGALALFAALVWIACTQGGDAR